MCPPETAVCGIRTQVERSRGKGELNNVDLACCRVPHQANIYIKGFQIVLCNSKQLTTSSQTSTTLTESVKLAE